MGDTLGRGGTSSGPFHGSRAQAGTHIHRPKPSAPITPAQQVRSRTRSALLNVTSAIFTTLMPGADNWSHWLPECYSPKVRGPEVVAPAL
ncbi:hypothetical protein GCM10010507_19780 [Streptomyces cinnamoneus]|uniref:Uncharacterized protein n=1 Tax=Streptomyces cinnamoneus TaxID=53446 RepID=A0A918TG03_STRCJ|nr:hypothetical protein GCM10010507_19780 [Streptomyces cinnamoneus]